MSGPFSSLAMGFYQFDWLNQTTLWCQLSGTHGVSILMNMRYTYNANTATAVHKHCHDLEHENDIDSIQIVGHASNKFHLRIKESLLCSLVKPTIINVQKKSIPLYVFGGWGTVTVCTEVFFILIWFICLLVFLFLLVWFYACYYFI